MDRWQARAVLRVADGAPPPEVERAFRRAAREAHPDAGGDADRFRRVVEARAILLRPAAPDPLDLLVRATVTVLRYHPLVWLLDELGRLATKSSPPRQPPRPR